MNRSFVETNQWAAYFFRPLVNFQNIIYVMNELSALL